jgi:hypothetical protein
MKHDWKRDYHMVNSRRKCRNCGAEQEYQCVSYDRMSGSRYGWKPNAGRCKPAKTAPINSPNAERIRVANNTEKS